MARPKKATVDYFPHQCDSGKTLFVLEQKFGNDGYAFWFKTLEMLGKSDGHYIDCENPASWEFLLAKTRVDEETAYTILETLANLEAIDRQLWAQRVIFSANFIENVRDAYKRRIDELPSIDTVYANINRLEKEFLYTETPNKGQSVRKNRESKVKESRVEESKEENTCAEPQDDSPPIVEIPLIKKHGLYSITQNQVDEWQDTYPGINVLQELRKCREWNVSNPERRKTPRGIRNHVTSWLGRAQDKARPVKPPRKPDPASHEGKHINHDKARREWLAYVRDMAENDPGALQRAIDAGDVTQTDLADAGVEQEVS